MAGFFHFLPVGREEITTGSAPRAACLERFGLGDVLADVETCPDDVILIETPDGPSGTGGAILYPKSPRGDVPPGLGFRPELQEWREIDFGENRVRWLGWEKEAPPTPEELERKVIFDDYGFDDGHGRHWLVPCARSTVGNSSLPFEYGFEPSGAISRKIAPQFERLWKLSAEVLDTKTRRIERDEAWRVRAALECLSVNYRVGPAEVTALRDLGLAILTYASVKGILGALVDQDLTQEAEDVLFEKKTETGGNGRPQPPRPGSSNVSAGPGADSPDTTPAAAP